MSSSKSTALIPIPAIWSTSFSMLFSVRLRYGTRGLPQKLQLNGQPLEARRNVYGFLPIL